MGVCASLAACLCFFVCLCLLCFEANKYDDDDDEYGREWVKHGWGNNGRRGRDGGGKERGSASTPPKLFSRGCACLCGPN